MESALSDFDTLGYYNLKDSRAFFTHAFKICWWVLDTIPDHEEFNVNYRGVTFGMLNKINRHVRA